MPLEMQPLSDKFGVAITNVDLSKDIYQSLFTTNVDVFVKKQVLVFRDQHIEPQHQGTEKKGTRTFIVTESGALR